MPRAGWLALGAVVAALASNEPWTGRAALSQPATWLVIGGVAGCAFAVLQAAVNAGSSFPGRAALRRVVAFGAGGLLVGARLVAMPLTVASPAEELPTGDGPWT